jgi:hypothetical protein
MNTEKKLISIVLLIASLSAVLVLPTGLFNAPERDNVNALFSGGNNDNNYDEAENVDASVIYYDSNDQIIEDPYQVGWD